MENIKYYELEETYHSEKSSFEFPTVSYTKDTDKVWYMKNNQIKMMFSITEDDVNNYNGEDLMVWENSILFDSVKVDGVEQKVPLQEKNVIITGETSEEVVVDITLENSVTQGEVVLPQPISMTIEEDGNSSSELPYIINITDENKLPFSSGKITVKLTNTSLNNLSYRPSFYVRYSSTIDVEDMIERTEYTLLDWYTAKEAFSMLVNDDGTEMTLTLPSEVNITHLFIVPMDSAMDSDIAEPLESQVEGIYLDENGLLYSYDTNNIILPCQLICGGGFILDESCWINEENIKKCDLIFNEPISEDKVIDMDKYFLTISFQGYNDGIWINYINFTQPLSFFIEEGMTDGFIVNEKPELVGLDLYYCTEGLVSVLGPTARMLAHVVYDENAVYDEENNNFIVNVNEDTLVGSYINMIIGGIPLLSLPTTEVKNYEVVVTKYNDVTDMSWMFSHCYNLTSIDLSSFSTSNVTNMNRMFNGCSGLISLDVSNWDTSNVTNMSYMFFGCDGLTSLDLSNFDTSKVTNMECMFYNCDGLTTLIFGGNFDTSNVTNMRQMFFGCNSLTSLDLSSFNTSNVTDMYSMFHICTSLTSIDLSGFDTSNVTNMINMFNSCSSLSSLDLSSFDTSNVTTMYMMFSYCTSLTSIDLSGFDTSNVTNMYGMFSYCYDLTSVTFGDNFNTSNVTDISFMFQNCKSLTSLDLSNFDTSHVTDMSWMFYDCYRLTSLDLSNFNTSKVTDMNYMFRFCSDLTSLDLSSFNTSNVTDMDSMFYRCSGLTSLDLSSFNTSNVTNMYFMFDGCKSLTSVTFGPQADVGKVTKYSQMFNTIYTTGTLYYPLVYADAWNNLLVTKQSSTYFPSKWTAVPIDYENGETVPTV